MIRPAQTKTTTGVHRRKSRLLRAAIALAATPLLLSLDCSDEAERNFKQASFDQIETGVKSILDGLVTGFFALNDGDSTDTATTETTE